MLKSCGIRRHGWGAWVTHKTGNVGNPSSRVCLCGSDRYTSHGCSCRGACNHQAASTRYNKHQMSGISPCLLWPRWATTPLHTRRPGPLKPTQNIQATTKEACEVVGPNRPASGPISPKKKLGSETSCVRGPGVRNQSPLRHCFDPELHTRGVAVVTKMALVPSLSMTASSLKGSLIG